jgi:hydroxymethylbilane synthase
MTRVRIATRGSDLALTQANYIAERIYSELALETELVVIQTSGDRMRDVSLAKVGGKGLFVKEIEEALLADRADVAVHSAKDLPAEIAPGLTLAAFPQRVDPRDALVSHQADLTLEGLPRGARVGTGSSRRMALLLAARPDLEVVPLRGNVPTRIAKLESESLQAVVLACAGLERLGLTQHIAERISPDVMLPAVCQGILALETREGDRLTSDIRRLGDPDVALSAAAERSFLRRLKGDCTTPLAVYAEIVSPERIRLRGMVASLDGRSLARAELEADRGAAVAAGQQLAESVLREGGADILEALRVESEAAGDGGEGATA